MNVGHWTPTFEPFASSAVKPVPFEEQPPIPEKKPLPSTLKYVFLREAESYPVVISVSLSEGQETSLLKMLKKHRRALKISKVKMKFMNDQHILRKSFEVGQKILLYNFWLHLFPGKLQSKWSEPFVVQYISSHGAIKIQTLKNENVFKVNEYRLKPYLELKKRKVEFVDLHDPPPFE